MSTAALLAGLGGLINTAGFAVYDPDRTWSDADTAVPVFPGALPDSPSKVIGMMPYTLRDDPRLNDSLLSVQFRIRGDADQATVLTLNDALFDLFQGLHDVTVGGVPVVLMWRQNSLPGGRDQNDRYEHTASYYLQVAWPTSQRTD